MSNKVKIAAVQMDIAFRDIDANLQAIKQHLINLKSEKIFIGVFPECSLTGYCYQSLDEAREFALTRNSQPIVDLCEMAKQFHLNLVFGFLELQAENVFNAAAIATRHGKLHVYHKVHLPFLGVDRFTTPGQQPFEPIDVEGLKVGLNICYDCSFPESARVLALKGADVILLPTNWPTGALTTSRCVPNARALENNIYFVAVDRIGNERGVKFIGMSKICDPNGANLQFADHNRPDVLIAEIDPDLARQKNLIRSPGEYELYRFEDRRPELYSEIVESPVRAR